MRDELVTRRYSQVEGLRRRGLMSRAAGPCAMDGCEYEEPGRVYDHCHAHDYIRGVLCLWHNGSMRLIDAHVMIADRYVGGRSRDGAARETAAKLAHWARCPECAASGEWQPYVTELEYKRDQVVRTIVSLADEIAGRRPGRRQSPNVVALREQLAALESWLSRHPEISRS